MSDVDAEWQSVPQSQQHLTLLLSLSVLVVVTPFGVITKVLITVSVTGDEETRHCVSIFLIS